MSAAPYNAHSQELGQDLGGWSDAALMAELSRRTTYDSDENIAIEHSGAGVRFSLRDASSPIAVAYDDDADTFTITVTDMRYGYGTPAIGHASQGLFQNASWEFNGGDGAVHLVYIGEVRPAAALATLARPYLMFVDPAGLSVSTSWEIDPDVTPNYHHIVTINLNADGTSTIGDGPEASESDADGIRRPHIHIEHQQTYWAEITEHVSGNNYRAKMWRTEIGYFAKDDATTARSPDLENQDLYAIHLVHGPVIGDDNPPFLATRTRDGRFEFQPAVWRRAR